MCITVDFTLYMTTTTTPVSEICVNHKALSEQIMYNVRLKP